jgi:GNAT superfamily N-acetyltransferase
VKLTLEYHSPAAEETPFLPRPPDCQERLDLMKYAPSHIIDFLRQNWRLTQPSCVEAHGALLLIDPFNDTPYPSASRNTVNFFDANKDKDDELLCRARDLIETYKMRGCSHCFVYVQPTETVQRVMRALTAAGFSRYDVGGRRPTYHTLWRELGAALDALPSATCEYPIRRLPAGSHDGGVIERFGAFDGNNCIGRASLHVISEYALLASASTDEAYRNRGVQSALIRTRLERALERACRGMASETLSILTSSLNNLRRAGFEILYDKPVFEWRDATRLTVSLGDGTDAAVFARWRRNTGM